MQRVAYLEFNAAADSEVAINWLTTQQRLLFETPPLFVAAETAHRHRLPCQSLASRVVRGRAAVQVTISL